MRKVLLAEDDMIMVSLIETLLNMEGFQVVAMDAEADIPAAVRREQPDVLLLDVYLGKQSGLEILDSLRSTHDTKDVHVVMTSGMNLKEDCIHRGANEFLLKPYTPDELIEILKKNVV